MGPNLTFDTGALIAWERNSQAINNVVALAAELERRPSSELEPRNRARHHGLKRELICFTSTLWGYCPLVFCWPYRLR